MQRIIPLLVAMLPLAYGGLSCLDNNLDSVAWYAALKVPDKFLASYTDSTVDSEALSVFPGHLINTTKSSIGGTIDQVFQNKNVAFVSWNDECPSNSGVKQKEATSYHAFRSARNYETHRRRRRVLEESAHSKGIIAWDGTRGFWLVHSVPKFPDYNDQSYSWSGDIRGTYAQSFLCVSLDQNNIEIAAKQIQYMDTNICSSNMPSSLSSDVPNLSSLIDGRGDHDEMKNVQTLQAVNGQKFISFSKDGNWGKDLYEDFVEPTLKLSFYWQTWRRSSGVIEPSVCDSLYKSQNVLYIEFLDDNTTWHYTKDHSKYGVSSDAGSSYICIGGINRMESQRKRGGGTLCFESNVLHSQILNAFKSVERC